MPQQCRVCEHPDLDEISRALVSSAALSATAERFSVSVDSLKRHKRNHLTPAVTRVALERRNDGAAFSAYDSLQDLLVRASALMTTAEEKGAVVGGAAVLRELRSIIETLAKLTGELDERPTLTVNVLSSPEVTQLVTTLLQALGPFPDARIAAAAALDALPVIDVEALS